jgi:WhiB family transcriptional regulator, redox-sensing transcriptional regulator
VLVRSVPLEGGACPPPEAGEAAAHELVAQEPGALGTLLDAAPRDGLDLPCRSGDADLWFAESPAELERAKALCGECPVRAACLAGALEREEPWGVWGGEIFERGVVVPRKRPRGRPSKADLARDRAFAAAAAAAVSA